MINIHDQRILILDFGSQYAQLIARRVRELGVYCELHPWDLDDQAIEAFSPSGIILSGGPESVTGEGSPRAAGVVFELGCPVLGICYGMQTMAAQLGGAVSNAEHHEYGYAQLVIKAPSHLFEGIEDETNTTDDVLLDVWMSHGDRVDRLPPDFQVIASSTNAPIAAIADEERRFYGIQFHPEVTQTRQGQRMLGRFVHDICGCEPVWTCTNIAEDMIERIRKEVHHDQVLLGLSGGVDSSVVAALLHRAIGHQLTCVFIDHGLLRLNEVQTVLKTFEHHLGVRVIHVDAKEKFFNALKSVHDPEEKRKIIGRLFIEVFEEESKKLEAIAWLAQGTIYSDVIESAAGSGKSHVIKSHHNVGGLPSTMKFKLLEPLRELFKDEVRKLGLELGLPYEMVYRHPFPGPGLAVRILGDVKEEYAIILRKADAIFIEELHKHQLYDQVSQAFAVFMPVRSVAVKGDARHYDYVIALRAVETLDFMTAHWARLPHEVLGAIADRIINEVSGVSRVVYDISGKPPATIEWE